MEAQIPVRAGEREGMVLGHRLSVHDPLIHAPEVGVTQVQLQRADDSGRQGKPLRGPDGPADPRGPGGRGLAPGMNVLQGLGQVELLGVVEHYREAGAR